MSEAQNGSAMLAGNPAGQPAADQNAGGAPAASTPPADGGNSTPPASGTWYDKFEDQELKGYVQNKGWKDPSELAVGYKNLEKLLGGEKLPMPKGADDKEGWARVYDAMGRPKTAEEYKLPVPEGDPGNFAKAAAGKFHELGISQTQAEQLATWWNETQQGQMAQQQQLSTQKVEQELSSLKGEWGQAWDENINLGSRAAKEFGLDQAKLSAIEQAMGTGEMLKFMAKIGRGLTEHNFEGGNTTQGFGMTPAAAKERISALQADKDFSSKYLSGNADAQAEMRKLMGIAYPSEG
jgi:hypothetical protein